MGSHQAVCLGLNITRSLRNLSTHCLQSLQMKVNRTATNRTTTRHGYFCMPISSKNGTQYNNRSPHFADIFVGSFFGQWLSCIYNYSIFILVKVYLRIQATNNIVHGKNIRKDWHILEYCFSLTGQDCCRQQRQHRIFSSFNPNSANQTVISTLNNNFFHTN